MDSLLFPLEKWKYSIGLHLPMDDLTLYQPSPLISHGSDDCVGILEVEELSVGLDISSSSGPIRDSR